MARDQVLLPAASMACKAPARPEGSAGEMGSSRAGAAAAVSDVAVAGHFITLIYLLSQELSTKHDVDLAVSQ